MDKNIRLKTLRQSLALTSREMARRLELDENSISRVERGDGSLRPATWALLARMYAPEMARLGLTLADLIEGGEYHEREVS